MSMTELEKRPQGAKLRNIRRLRGMALFQIGLFSALAIGVFAAFDWPARATIAMLGLPATLGMAALGAFGLRSGARNAADTE